ncbi:hypothetical protein [Microbacterium sp. BH-3-3-3]|uniref:hypothetical protein n=1 Tax=Microbacterium sp. BH-3-3-3 TaxID=1906742 RepID=UPI0011A6FAB2|nr:hypothetical protein [Microbacterium sp. BH-3-3-3]
MSAAIEFVYPFLRGDLMARFSVDPEPLRDAAENIEAIRAEVASGRSDEGAGDTGHAELTSAVAGLRASAMRNKPRFVYEINGSSFANLVNGPRSYEDNLRRMLSLLGTADRSTFTLSKLPDGQDVWDVTRDTLPSVFLQAAGTADAMTVEWRRLDQDGVERIYTVGRSAQHRGAPAVVVKFLQGTAQAVVYPDELFSAKGASEIFVHYFHTLAVPDRYTLRELSLTTRT